MHKLTLKLAVCLAALVTSSTAYAGSPVARFALGQTGNTVEVSKCGDKFCFRIEKEGEAKKSSDSSATSDDNGGFSFASLFGSDKGTDSSTFGLDELKKLAEAGSKLFGDQLPSKSASATDAPKQAAAPPASERKAAPPPVVNAAPKAPAIVLPAPTTAQAPARFAAADEATSQAPKVTCKKYLPQIGEIVPVPCN